MNKQEGWVVFNEPNQLYNVCKCTISARRAHLCMKNQDNKKIQRDSEDKMSSPKVHMNECYLIENNYSFDEMVAILCIGHVIIIACKHCQADSELIAPHAQQAGQRSPPPPSSQTQTNGCSCKCKRRYHQLQPPCKTGQLHHHYVRPH